MNVNHLKKGAVTLALLITAIALRPCVIVGAGHRGVVLNWGAVSGNVLSEGIHFRVPIMQSVVKMDIQTQKFEVKTEAYSKDIQQVDTTLALNYGVRAEAVNTLYQEVGREYLERLIVPAVQESVKSATAKFTAQNLVEDRPKVKEEIKMELIKRLEKYFAISEFSITDFQFSSEYEKAVEEKQVAQQSALKAENDLTRIKTEAEQRIAGARAEATAIKIQAEAITQQGGEDYVRLKAIERWNGVLPTQMIPGSTVPFINVTK